MKSYEPRKEYLPNSWLDPRIEIRPSKIQGAGIFTREAIKEGEVIIIFGGKIFTREDIVSGRVAPHSYIAVNDNLYLGHAMEAGRSEDDFINHSCDPNLWLIDEVTLVARRDIAAGEELTADYASWWNEKDLDPHIQCNCGSPLCRKVITELDWSVGELQARYTSHFSPLILRSIHHLK